jgi:hypothetical protein
MQRLMLRSSTLPAMRPTRIRSDRPRPSARASRWSGTRLCSFPSREAKRLVPRIGAVRSGRSTLTRSKERHEYLPRGASLPAQCAQPLERCAAPIFPIFEEGSEDAHGAKVGRHLAIFDARDVLCGLPDEQREILRPHSQRFSHEAYGLRASHAGARKFEPAGTQRGMRCSSSFVLCVAPAMVLRRPKGRLGLQALKFSPSSGAPAASWSR